MLTDLRRDGAYPVEGGAGDSQVVGVERGVVRPGGHEDDALSHVFAADEPLLAGAADLCVAVWRGLNGSIPTYPSGLERHKSATTNTLAPCPTVRSAALPCAPSTRPSSIETKRPGCGSMYSGRKAPSLLTVHTGGGRWWMDGWTGG